MWIHEDLVQEMPSSASLFTYLTFRGGSQAASRHQDQVFCTSAAAHRLRRGPQGKCQVALKNIHICPRPQGLVNENGFLYTVFLAFSFKRLT